MSMGYICVGDVFMEPYQGIVLYVTGFPKNNAETFLGIEMNFDHRYPQEYKIFPSRHINLSTFDHYTDYLFLGNFSH